MFFKWRSGPEAADAFGPSAYAAGVHKIESDTAANTSELPSGHRFIKRDLHCSLSGLPFASSDRLAILKDDKAVPPVKKYKPCHGRRRLWRHSVKPCHDAPRPILPVTAGKHGDSRTLVRLSGDGHCRFMELQSRATVRLHQFLQPCARGRRPQY